MDEVAVNALLRRLVVVGRNAQYARDTFVETRFEFGGNLCASVATYPEHHRDTACSCFANRRHDAMLLVGG